MITPIYHLPYEYYLEYVQSISSTLLASAQSFATETKAFALSWSTRLSGSDLFWYVLMMSGSESPTWFGVLSVSTMETVVAAAIGAKPTTWSLLTGAYAVDSST